MSSTGASNRAVWTARQPNARGLEGFLLQLVVRHAIRRPHEVVVELVVHLRRIEGELVRVHDENRLGRQRVRLVALALEQLHRTLRGRGLDHREMRRVNAARQAEERAVLPPAVLRVVAVPALAEEREVALGERGERTGGNLHLHHLGVAQLAVVADALEVVVAHAVIRAYLRPSRIAGDGSDRTATARERGDLFHDELVLYVPEAAGAKVYFDHRVFLCGGGGRGGGGERGG
mmetsp:Transcript_24124/g.59965  ORF Transcript_24124/g.59965 Transcript_24124/m.59965 type:complete len:233 (-) Transcript_24124:137-835(-)